jgi:1-acyl-sn-glycerol-3-phosphate acyltransferase
MRRAGHIMIDRFNRARAFEAYAQAAETIRSGISPIVFPEGTRSPTGELQPFKNAPFGLAIAAQVPIVPVYVDGTYRILRKGGLRLRPMPIRIQIGEPIPTAGLSADDREGLRDRVRAAISELKTRVDAAGPSR